jgi:hypothetical protein
MFTFKPTPASAGNWGTPQDMMVKQGIKEAMAIKASTVLVSQEWFNEVSRTFETLSGSYGAEGLVTLPQFGVSFKVDPELKDKQFKVAA